MEKRKTLETFVWISSQNSGEVVQTVRDSHKRGLLLINTAKVPGQKFA
jgi:hypothetical protein